VRSDEQTNQIAGEILTWDSAAQVSTCTSAVKLHYTEDGAAMRSDCDDKADPSLTWNSAVQVSRACSWAPPPAPCGARAPPG
jgi:hypothetical protein